MANESTVATETRTGLDSIATLRLYPSFEGVRVMRSFAIRIWEGEGDDKKLVPDPLKRKFEISAPVPKDEKECQKMYGRSLTGEGSLAANGARQATYDADNDPRLSIAEAVQKGTDLQSDEFTTALTREFEEALRAGPKVRESKAREIKAKAREADDMEAKTGLTPSQMQSLYTRAIETKKPIPTVLKEMRAEGLLPQVE